MANALLILAAIYGGVTGLAYLLQDHLIYLPHKLSVDHMERKAAALGLVPWPAGATDVRGFLAQPPVTRTKGTVIVFHGNAGTGLDRTYYIEPLSSLGYRVILAEYPGYASRPGRPNEKKVVTDAVETVRIASQAFGLPLFLVGESLGAAVAAAAVAQNGLSAKALVLITPWDTLPNMAQSAYWFLPARWLVRDTYDTIRNLKSYQGRIAVLMAEHDEIVPTRLTQNLYRSLTQQKRLWTLPGAGHNGWPALMPKDFWVQVMGFLNDGISDSSAEKAKRPADFN